MGRGPRRYGLFALYGLAGLLALALFVALLLARFAAWRDWRAPLPTARDSGLIGAEELSFASADGTPLAGWFAPGQADKTPWVLVHGIVADRRQMLQRARIALALGHGVLLLDLRHHGASGGATTTFGAFEAEDVRAAAAALLRRTGSPRVGVWGFSLGAAAVLLAAPGIQGLAALIAESPYDTLEHTLAVHWRLMSGLPDWPVVPLTQLFLGLASGYDPSAIDTVAAARAQPAVPYLVVVGDRDVRVPPGAAERIRAAHGPAAHLLILPAGHGDFLERAPKPYLEALQKILRETDAAK